MSNPTPLVVLGLGNVLLEDDGVGAAAVALLQERYEAPESVLVLDGGTLGLALLPYVQNAERVLLLDAILADGVPPGGFVRLEGDEVGPAVATRLSPHQVGVADLLDGVRLLDQYPKTVVLLGLVPRSMDLHIGLSDAVAAGLSELVERAAVEAAAMGFPFRPRTTDETPAPGGHSLDVARLAGLRS
jgi:hydrogenase maturation protease